MIPNPAGGRTTTVRPPAEAILVTTPVTDAHVRLDTHPAHRTAVVATVTGPHRHVAYVGLEAANWTAVDKNTLVLARIDHEEPYWAGDAARELAAAGIAVEITPPLRQAMIRDWTWPEYPVPWSTRAQSRKVSTQAQKIYDDIRHGHLSIHAHAKHGLITLAVGTYLSGGKSVLLHGKNHLRKIIDTYGSPAEALTEFEKNHGAAMRIGPACPTDTERATAEARISLSTRADEPERALPNPEAVPAYAVDHDALLNDFLDTHGQWEKWRTWSDGTTHAVHESLVLRAEFVHEADPDDTQWRIAAYESPVGERLWHATSTTTVPVEIMRVLLDSLASGDALKIAAGSQVSDETISQATRPLAGAGWEHVIDGRWIRWQAPGDDPVGVQFDAFAAGQRPDGALPTWTVWGGNASHQPAWLLEMSAHFPTPLLHDVTFELAEGQGVRTVRPPQGPALRTIQADVAPTPPTPLPH